MDLAKGQLTKTAFIAISISALLIILVILNHNLSFKSTIVLPAGGTYLGPSPTPSSAEPAGSAGGLIRGKKYPYSFTAPDGVPLVSLGGEFDIYALSINNQPPEQNVLIGVDDLRRSDDLKQYIKGSKRAYVENWYKQFGGLKGVESLTEFTNTNGLKGYRAKYTNGSTNDIFFEVADPNFVIHLANGPLEKEVFEKIVDSVEWSK